MVGLSLITKAILAGPLGVRQLYLLRARRGWQRTAIIDSYPENAREIARAVIEKCQRNSISSDFPVEIEDSLGLVYGFAGEDFVDLVVAVCDQRALERPVWPDFWRARVRTVNELIEYISRQSRKNSPNDRC
jgi:hypothetical protein